MMEGFFTCPVCMSTMKNTHITVPCGHHYCHECIRESIERHHKCPLCNEKLDETDLVKDFQYDEIIKVWKAEREQKEDERFKTILQKADEPIHDTNTYQNEVKIDPIEAVLHKHLKKSLVSHEDFLQGLHADTKKKEHEGKMKYQSQLAKMEEQGAEEKEISKLKDKHQSDVSHLHEVLDFTVKKVAEAYDRYLTNSLPALNILPVNVTLRVPSQGIEIENIWLSPKESIECLRDRLVTFMDNNGDPLTRMVNTRYICFSPFKTSHEDHELVALCEDVIEGKNTNGFIVPDDTMVQLQYGLMSGSVIVIYGEVLSVSTMPKKCFSVMFELGVFDIMDYFTCQTCNYNWICKDCMNSCHKGHTLVPYIYQHKATWPCCYCPRKKSCSINTP